MERGRNSDHSLSANFAAATNSGSSREKRPPPFSIRFTEEERAWLNREAGNLPPSHYIRAKLFPSDVVMQSARRSIRRAHQPRVDQPALASALGLLGQSRLSSNLNQLAKAANLGVLPVTPDLEADLEQACVDVRAMRSALMAALGLKDHSGTASAAESRL